MGPDSPANEPTKRLTVELRGSTLAKLDKLREEWGFKSRGATLQRLLDELFREPSGD